MLVGALDAIMGNPFITPKFNMLDADGIIANHVLTSFSDDIKGKRAAYPLGSVKLEREMASR